MKVKELKLAQDYLLNFISQSFIYYVIDFITESEITMTSLFTCYIQNIIYRIKIVKTGKVNI